MATRGPGWRGWAGVVRSGVYREKSPAASRNPWLERGLESASVSSLCSGHILALRSRTVRLLTPLPRSLTFRPYLPALRRSRLPLLVSRTRIVLARPAGIEKRVLPIIEAARAPWGSRLFQAARAASKRCKPDCSPWILRGSARIPNQTAASFLSPLLAVHMRGASRSSGFPKVCLMALGEPQIGSPPRAPRTSFWERWPIRSAARSRRPSGTARSISGRGGGRFSSRPKACGSTSPRCREAVGGYRTARMLTEAENACSG
jgi:hypothetical protein